MDRAEGNIVTEIFEDFFTRLETTEDVDRNVLLRLRELLLVEKNFSQAAIQNAFFNEDEATC